MCHKTSYISNLNIQPTKADAFHIPCDKPKEVIQDQSFNIIEATLNEVTTAWSSTIKPLEGTSSQ